MKSILSIFLCFIIINTSVAKSDEKQVLKITRFSPSNLATYLPTNTEVEKRIYNTHNDYEVKYDVVYQSKPITLTIQSSHPLDLADFQGTSYETVKLTNISNTAELKKWECNDKICSYAIFSSDDISGEGYSTTISYALPMHDVHIGEDFMKSLFIEETNCQVIEPTSTVAQGPFKIDIKFESNEAMVFPKNYSAIAEFAQFIKENDVNVNIEGHTDRTEARTVSGANYEASLALSIKRAEAVRTLLIKNFGVSEDKIIKTEGNAYDRPLNSNDTEEGRQMNRRVQAYIYGD